MEPNFKFKHSESFVLRNGWGPKALQELKKHPHENVFSKTTGVLWLGVGSNMVTSIKYWLDAAHIIKESNRLYVLDSFGKLIEQYDPYMEDPLTWELVHYQLVDNIQDCPLFTVLFQQSPTSYSFTRQDFDERALEQLSLKYPSYSFNSQYIDDDSMVLIRSYVSERSKDPEDNLGSPLSSLGLLEAAPNDHFRKTRIPLDLLDPRLVFFLLNKALGKKEDSIEANDAFLLPEGPAQLFNLDFGSFMSLLSILHNQGFITLTKTSGLNVIYISEEKRSYTLAQLFKDHFGGAQ